MVCLFDNIFSRCCSVPAGGEAHLLAHVVMWRGSIFLIWYGINFSTCSAAFFPHKHTPAYPSSPQWESSRFSRVSPPPVRKRVAETVPAVWLLVPVPDWDVSLRRAMFYLTVSSRNSIRIMCVTCCIMGPALQIYHPLKIEREMHPLQDTTPIKVRFPIWDLTLQPHTKSREVSCIWDVRLRH